MLALTRGKANEREGESLFDLSMEILRRQRPEFRKIEVKEEYRLEVREDAP
jgi:hypothetical protein